MSERNQKDPTRAGVILKRATALATLTALALAAGCSAKSEGGPSSSERPSATASAKPKGVGQAVGNLIFVSNRAGYDNIYEKNLASGKIRALTRGANTMNPEASPDGKDLVFYSDASGSNQIDTLSLGHPGYPTQLTHEKGGVNAYDPVYTPTGKEILYKVSNEKGNYGNIWEMNADGSDQHPVTTSLSSHHLEGWKPTLINDKQAIITVRSHQDDPYSDNLDVLNLETGTRTPVTHNALSNWFPDYNQTAGRVVFVTKQQPGGHDVLDTMLPDGGDREPIVDMRGDTDDPAWSPDGDHLVFINNGTDQSSVGHPQYNVYEADRNGGGVHILDRSPPGGSNDLSPSFLPS